MTMQKPFPLARIDAPNAPGAIGSDASEAATGPTVDLLVLLRILRVRREVILGAAGTVLVIALIVLFQLTPLYSSSAIVMLNEQKNNVEDVTSVLSGLPTDPASIQNQVQILTSRSLAARVIDRLDLKDEPDFRGARTGWFAYIRRLNPVTWLQGGQALQNRSSIRSDQDILIDYFLKHITVAPIGLSTTLKVTYQSPDAAESAKICNAIADAYVEDQLNAKFEATQRATRWLADRIQDLSRQSQTAEAAVQQYRASNGLTTTATGGSVVDQQMTDISGQLVVAKSDLAEKQATYSHVSELAKEGKAADISQAVASPLIAQLRSQEADLIRQEADMSSKYGPRNPKMIEIESQKANLESKIAEEINRVVQSVANDVAIAQAHVTSLQASLEKIESESSEQNKLKVKLAALESTASSAKSMYEAFLSKLNQTQDQQGIQTPDARIISRAETPESPSYPNKLLVIGIAIPGGLLLGLLFAFTLEKLDSGFRTTYQIENLLGVPVLATIPEIVQRTEVGPESAASRVIDKPMSSFSEAIRGLQLALALSNVDKTPKIVLVTSSVPGEGKSTLALSLVRLAARSGLKAIVIDADLRRPAIAQAVGITKSKGDLVDVISGTAALQDCLVRDPRSDALILPCLHKPVSPSDLLGSQAMHKLVGQLAETFDLVVIDSAPILPVNDTKVLSRLADAVLFVVRWEKTPREGVANALRSLADVNAPVAGVAFSRADMARFQYYSYGYQDYQIYNKYYSD